MTFSVGQRVRKAKGYAFDSTVRSVFTNEAGAVRLVCESSVIPGMLHIFSPEQMERETADDDGQLMLPYTTNLYLPNGDQ